MEAKWHGCLFLFALALQSGCSSPLEVSEELALNSNLFSAAACTDREGVFEPQVKRLTPVQIKNSLLNAFGPVFGDNFKVSLPDGNPRLGVSSDPNQLEFNPVNFSELFDQSNQWVDLIISNHSQISNCATTPSATCFQRVLDVEGQRLWRRPLRAEESALLLSSVESLPSDPQYSSLKIRQILMTLILSDHHLYRFEGGDGGSDAISGYDLASLLSFTAWNRPPDDELLSLAKDGSLKDPNVLRAQIKRLSQSPFYREKIADFLMDVLKVDDVLTVAKKDSFSLTPIERSLLRESAYRSILDSLDRNENQRGLFAPFFSSRFANRGELAKFVDPTQALSNSWQFTEVNPSQRVGILSHPAFLSAMSKDTHSGIVMRGVFTLEQLLCFHLPAPPDDIQGVSELPPGFDPNQETSRVVLEVTHSKQSSCVACHQIIDPAGFGWENYDAAGRFRTTEKGNLRIDASGSLAGLRQGQMSFSDSVDYLKKLADSQEFKACLTKHLFHEFSGLAAESSQGSCEYKNFEHALAQKNHGILSHYLDSFFELRSSRTRRPATVAEGD